MSDPVPVTFAKYGQRIQVKVKSVDFFQKEVI